MGAWDFGIDTIESSISLTLPENVEKLILSGSSDLNATGNSLENTLTGNSGNNVLDGMSGADVMVGGAGNDIYYTDNVDDQIKEFASEGVDTEIRSAHRFGNLAANVEQLILVGDLIEGLGNDLDNTLTGNDANNTLNGFAGNDHLLGGAGDDILDGGAGNDTMEGGLGDDIYVVESSSDVVLEIAEDGIDSVLSSVTMTLGANVENLTLMGTSGINGTGNALNNVLIGNSANNSLSGGDGNDVLDGKEGADNMSGGLGDDIYYVDSSADTVSEGTNAGYDVVNSSVTMTLGKNIENLILIGNAAVNGTGNSLVNYLYGNSSGNTLNGGSGNDILEGGDGNDTLTDTSGKAYMNGGAGDDSLTGGSSAELFIGGTGNDILTTSTGTDVIAFNRGDGIDTINESKTADNTVSLGNGISYDDLSFRKENSDLILDVGNSESLVFKNWYAPRGVYKSIATLQVILDATEDYNPSSTNPTLDNKIEQFSFSGLASAFDQALAANPGLTSWSLTNALTQYHLGGSNEAALGGDLAYWYGKNGSLSGMNVVSAQEVVASSNFCSSNQTIRPFTGLQDGMVKLA